MKHQYVERRTGRIVTERLFGDRIVNLLYSKAREDSNGLYRAFSSERMTSVLGFINFDRHLSRKASGAGRFFDACGMDADELFGNPEEFKTVRELFERKIRYWDCRPMPEGEKVVVSPADSRVIVGSFDHVSSLFIKEKFFSFDELIGIDKPEWLRAFADGDFAIFRLTPEKYHYNHCPVAGIVRDLYEISGRYHSCNPGAVVTAATPYSKNKRVVTVIDTDVSMGTQVGLVAFIEVVALMIGDIVQCYSEHGYDAPRTVARGMFLKKGVPKSLYRPGSSTDVLLFQKDRIRFAGDILENMLRKDAVSRFSLGFGKSLVETDVDVRSYIAAGKQQV